MTNDSVVTFACGLTCFPEQDVDTPVWITSPHGGQYCEHSDPPMPVSFREERYMCKGGNQGKFEPGSFDSSSILSLAFSSFLAFRIPRYR